MCSVLKVSRSRYYAWRKNPLSKRASESAILMKEVENVFLEGRQNYGARCIQNRLVQRGVSISRKRVAKLMKKAGLAPKTKRKFKVTTDSNHKLYIAPNLLQRQFYVAKRQSCVGWRYYLYPNSKWLALSGHCDGFVLA